MDSATGPGTLYCAECGRPTSPDELVRFGDFLVCPNCKTSYAQRLREGAMPAATFPYGGFWIRFLASLIDWIILTVVTSIVQYLFFGSFFNMPPMQPNASPEEIMAALGPIFAVAGAAWAVSTAIHCCYESIFIWKMGATPGKMALGLKVVRPDGSPLSLGRSIGRFFAKILSGLILLIGYIIAGFDSEKKALHDMICDTRVMKARL